MSNTGSAAAQNEEQIPDTMPSQVNNHGGCMETMTTPKVIVRVLLRVVTLNGGFWFAKRYVDSRVIGMVADLLRFQIGRRVHAKLRLVRMSLDEWITARGKTMVARRRENPKVPVGRKSSKSGEHQKLGFEFGEGVGGGAIRWERPSEQIIRGKERVRDAVIIRQNSVTRSSKRVVVIG